MATYPGMSLRGEVRESISLDDDDMSDVEDEVFIRDGKNGYKLAEEINVKRPLMAPRRKPIKPDLTTRLKNKPPCKAFFRPCCYFLVSLCFLIILIILVVVYVSIFPLRLDKLRDWIMYKSRNSSTAEKLLPCNNFKITDVWVSSLPKLTTDSPVRMLDVNQDGIKDVVFGFGTGDNYNILPPDTFCSIFMGVSPPCKGGIIALNGLNGQIIWRHWLNDTIFSLECTSDVNNDQLLDCLVAGEEGTIMIINSKNGTTIWKLNTGRLNLFVPNFIPDQNSDNISDILTSHSSLSAAKDGHIILLSGKTGEELNRMRIINGTKTFYMPQVLLQNSTERFVLIGTGSPNSPGNLSALRLHDIFSKNMTEENSITIYTDHFKGIFTQSILVDITGDNKPDVITAMYNSTLVAIDGETFKQLWNYTISSNAETNFVPIPGYFNDDNVTDFLIIYQRFDSILNNNYTQTFIINGKNGQSIYKPFTGSVKYQGNGVTLSMEEHGYDMFVFWTSECVNVDVYKAVYSTKENDDVVDECRQQFNSSTALKLQALNQYHEPPGLLIYNSANRTSIEFNNTKSALRQIKEYFLHHPKIDTHAVGQTEMNENYINNLQQPLSLRKYGSSSFRHKDKNTGIIKDYLGTTVNNNVGNANTDYDWLQPNQPNILSEDIDSEYNDNLEEPETVPNIYENLQKSSNRDPRSKEHKMESDQLMSTKKKNLSDPKYGIYGYKNVQLAKNRLLHDSNNVPTDILRDTYFKNEIRRLRKSKFEQRDINSHHDKIKDNDEVRKIIEEEKKEAQNMKFTLWDLESEKETQEKNNDFSRRKRENVPFYNDGIVKISSVGAVADSMNNTNETNSIDIIFITYWIPFEKDQQVILQDEVMECIESKMLKTVEEDDSTFQKTTDEEKRIQYNKECLLEQGNLKREFPYFNQIAQLKFGQMTVYRLRIECICDDNVNNVTHPNDKFPNQRCAKFLKEQDQSWPNYLGKLGDGVFQTRD